MTMTKKLWSLSALSVELNVDRRTLGKKLPPPDGKINNHGGWYLSTAIAAMQAPVVEESESDAELLRMAGEIEDELDRIAAEPSLARRCELLRVLGPKAGALDRAACEFVKDMKPGERAVCQAAVDHIGSMVLRAILELGNWHLPPVNDTTP